MVAITGQVDTTLLGRDAFQETDIVGVTMPITKHGFIVKDVTKLADTIRKAFAIAKSGRPGPVLVDITYNATAEKADFESLHFVIDKPDQFYTFNLDLKLEGTKPTSDSLNIVGTFSGNGSATIMGQDQQFDEVSGNVNGKLVRQ